MRVYPTGTNVLADAERQRPALFVLDIMVPGKDGLELCRTVRQTPGLASVPVIFLTAKSSEADRVLGLELGADDYIAKPFSPRELVAGVKAVLRRFERPLPPSPMKVGEIEIDPSAMTLTVRGHRSLLLPPSFACSIILPAIWDASSAAITCSIPSGATLPTSPPARRCLCPPHPRENRTGPGESRATLKPSAAPATASKPPNEEKVKNRIFFELLIAFLIVIATTTATLDFMAGIRGKTRFATRSSAASRRRHFSSLIASKATRAILRSDIAAQEGRSAGARAAIIDASGKVLADSEASPAVVENHASRKEFAAARAGKIGIDETHTCYRRNSVSLCRGARLRRDDASRPIPFSDVEAVPRPVRRTLCWRARPWPWPPRWFSHDLGCLDFWRMQAHRRCDCPDFAEATCDGIQRCFAG